MNWRADERSGRGPRRAGPRHGDWRAAGAALKLPPGAERPAAAAAQRRLADFWARHFGPAAARSTPLLFDSGRLAVVVEAAAWGHEIRHRAPGLLTELARAGIAATSLTVHTRPPRPRPRPRRPRAPLRLSPASAARLESLAATVAHPPLAAALRRLAKRASAP